jgi:hypothetical protein
LKIEFLPYTYVNLHMTIHDFFYNETNRMLLIDFSLKNDGDNTYRSLQLNFEEILYNSPTIINEKDLFNIDTDFIIELLDQYLSTNEPPEEEFF